MIAVIAVAKHSPFSLACFATPCLRFFFFTGRIGFHTTVISRGWGHTHDFPIVMLYFNLLKTLVSDVVSAFLIGSDTSSCVRILWAPSDIVLVWSVDFLICVSSSVSVLACFSNLSISVVDHWLVRLEILSNAGIYCLFSNLVAVWSLYLYHVFHLVEIIQRSSITFPHILRIAALRGRRFATGDYIHTIFF